MTIQFKGVVFDMDGVLIDSEPIVKHCGQIAARKFNGDLSDALYHDLIGLPANEVEQGLRTALGAKFPMAAFREELERLWEEFIHENGMPLKPGIKQALNTLQEHSIPYAIATSTPHERARLSLKIAGILDCFDVIVGGDQVSNGKPAPDIFISAAEKISIDPSQCIAVEDSAVGTRAATSAGMYTILIPDLKQPDGEIRELAHEIHQSMDHALPNIMALLQHTKPSNLS